MPPSQSSSEDFGLENVNKRLEILSNVASRLLMTDTPQAIVNDLCRDVLAFLDCDVFFNYIVDLPTRRLHLNTCGGVAEEVAHSIEWLDYGVAICGCVAHEGCRIISEDIQHNTDVRADLVRSMGIQAYACHPLMSRGKPIGTLSFGTRSRTTFTPDDLSLMKAVADHIAIAMERITTRERLRESEHRYRLLAESLPQLVWTCTPEGGCDYLSRQWVDYTGRSETEQLGRGWLEQVHPDDRIRTVERWQQSIENRKPLQVEFRLRGADGNYRWFDTRAVPIHDANGTLVKWFGSNTDVTERRQAEEIRKQLLEAERSARAEAERANKLKDEFLATISHELRTPLQAIIGWARLLEARCLDERSTEGVHVIRRNAHAQAKLIEDLLDMSRMMNGKLSLELQPLDAGLAVRAVAESMRPAAQAKQLTLTVSCGSLGSGLQADPKRFDQIIGNLLSNAIKFTPAAGRIDVEVRMENDCTLLVRVRDTGQGIKPEFVPCLFDRFRQENASITRKHGGLGLGLALVRHLVELHGGTVAAHSEGEGLGATFEVRLPMIGPGSLPEELPRGHRAIADQPAESFTDALSGVKVLLVDDEQDACELLRTVLEEAGAVVLTAANAMQGMEAFRRFSPDLVVSDIGMPDIDGYQFMRALRSLPADQGSTVPAVALTAFSRESDVLKARASGFQRHIAKPVEPAELVAGLGEVLRQCERPVTEHSLSVEAANMCACESTNRREEQPRKKVLLIEDSQDIAELIRLYLSSEEWMLQMAGSIAEAVELLQQYDFDIVLSDLSLPDGTGLSIPAHIRARNDRPAPKAIAMSGYSDQRDIRASLDAGFCEHLVKPVDEDHLVATLRRTLADTQASQPQ